MLTDGGDFRVVPKQSGGGGTGPAVSLSSSVRRAPLTNGGKNMAGSWLDNLELDPKVTHYISKGAEWHRLTPGEFVAQCTQRYVDLVLSADPAFIGTVMGWYVEDAITHVPGAAEIFEFR